MASRDAKLESGKLLSTPRTVTLLGSIFVALSSGTNYIYSAYAPQLGARLLLSHTQLNIIGLAGNLGGQISGPFWGRIVDRKGPRIPLIGASVSLLFGYLGIKQMYDNGRDNGAIFSTLQLALLAVCGFMTGFGGHAGISAAINTTAKSFPSSARATTTGLVLSGFGLSAFWFSSLAHLLFPGDTSVFLLILALGTAIPMLIGLFIVKPVPLQPTAVREGYDSVPSGDGVTFVGDVPVALDLEEVAEAEADFEPLLPHEDDASLYQVPVPSSAIELTHPASLHRKGIVREKGDSLDIYGMRLWMDPDFYLLCAITGLCSGTGLMYINNVGSISQALYAKTHVVYDDAEASKWQATQVSILSLGNFAGRVLIGLISDFAYTRLRLPRAYCLCLVSSLFIISQLAAIIITSVERLWIATFLLGLSYGALFGNYPTIMIEWFGLAHCSENMGYGNFSPIIGGNIFSLMFGRYLDAHASMQDARPSLATRIWSPASLLARSELPSEHQCFDGKACYLGSLQVTLVACIVSLGLSWWAGMRDGQKYKARNAS